MVAKEVKSEMRLGQVQSNEAILESEKIRLLTRNALPPPPLSLSLSLVQSDANRPKNKNNHAYNRKLSRSYEKMSSQNESDGMAEGYDETAM